MALANFAMPPPRRMISDISIIDRLDTPTYLVKHRVGDTRPRLCRIIQRISMDDPKTIGARIRLARTNKGLTQADLAAALGIVRSHLTNVEGGNDSLSLEKLSILAGETETTVAWLIGEAGAADPDELALLSAFRAMDRRGRNTLRRIAQTMPRDDAPDHPPPTPHQPSSDPGRRH